MKYKRVAATFALDKRVRQYATDLGDSRLLTKLAGGDMVATEAEYHANCLTSFYKLHLKYVERSSQTTTSNNIHGIVFAEVVAYIEEARYDDDKPMFKLVDLVQLYNDRLRELGEDDKVHSSRLKEKILSQIPNLSAHTSVHSQGQNVIIMFDRDVADLVQEERMYEHGLRHGQITKALQRLQKLYGWVCFVTVIPLMGHFHPTAKQMSYLHH